jgi:hypothetical protein
MSNNFIQKLFTSRDNEVNSNEYIGDQDRLWYDPVTNTLRVWTGDPGGKPVSGGGAGNIAVANSNVVVTPSVSSFNFVGGGITAAASGNDVTITVPGAGYITCGGVT